MQGWGGSAGLWGLLGLTPFLEEPLHPSFSILQGNEDLGVLGGGSFATQGQPSGGIRSVLQGKAETWLPYCFIEKLFLASARVGNSA